MQTRPLPGSDLRFSALTFGTMRLATKDPDDHASFALGKPALSATLLLVSIPFIRATGTVLVES